jgi:tetratricopeptide (TPR) repeat protein
MKLVLPLLAALCPLLASPAWAAVEDVCGSLEWNYGPHDYRKANSQQKKLVENAHFDRGVQNLTKTKTGPFGGDIGYTLSVFPNHAHALIVMERLVETRKKDPPEGASYTMECWYERALRFRPDDHIPRLLYVNYLIRKKRQDEAMKQLDYVANTTQDDPFAQFNTGMFYADLQAYDKALTQAHRVIALGFDRRELRERLTAAGKWVEPPAPPASAASASAR